MGTHAYTSHEVDEHLAYFLPSNNEDITCAAFECPPRVRSKQRFLAKDSSTEEINQIWNAV